MSLSECKTMGGNEHENVWTFIENIAAIALLLALLSMLLPFCKFSAGGQEMTLSGLDVVKAGGRAGYTYLTEGRVADTFVLKAPITVGTVKAVFLMYREWDRCGFWQFVALQHCSRCCFVFCLWECCFWRKEKDDAAANAVYQSGAGRTAGRFDCVSGTAFVPVGGDIFLYAAAWSCMDTHTDRMDYRRVPAIGEAGKRAEKRGKIRSSPDTAGGAKIPSTEKDKKKHGWKEDSSTKRRIQQKTKYLSGIIVRFL